MNKANLARRAGVLAPLFSLYSQKSLGIGELDDLRLLVDWSKKTGNSIIQLLPMNEVGVLFCPYDSISSFALEPSYLSLRLIPQAKKKETRKIFPLNKTHVDYGIKKEKIHLLWEVYLENSAKLDKESQQFKKANAYWINDFSLFVALKKHYQGKPWYEWEEKYKNRDPKALGDFKIEYQKYIDFQVWLQWLLFEQFKAVKDYAKKEKISIAGDLPFLVSRDSADVWQHPEFFKLDFAAGAPPDMYCAKGQRWGMPIYNWEQVASDGYTYLKEKLKYAQNFYDILRIDHVVGLFRIWSIPYNDPLENQGLNGFFDPQDETKWGEHGRNILREMLKDTKMLLCAEDLGMIPDVCTDALNLFKIPGNDVQRWAKDYKIKHDFLAPKDYRELSMAMLSNHDTTNWTAWWENEAGTVDEALFIRKTSDHRQIGFNNVKDKLFDPARSRHGRLRWLDSIDSVEKLIEGLSPKGTVPREHLLDFIDLYQDTYHEKEKLWKQLKIAGPMREKCDKEIVRAALKITLESSSIFCINTIIDWLFLTDVFKEDAYTYRINTPGTISPNNWSQVLTISLEELLDHKVNKEIRSLIKTYRDCL